MTTTFDPTGNIPALLKRMNPKVNQQAITYSPVIDGGHVPIFDKRQVEGSVIVKSGGSIKTGWIQDGATIEYGGTPPKRLVYNHKIMFGGFEIGRAAADQTRSLEEGVDLVMDHIETLEDDLGRQLARALYGSQIGTVGVATTANVSTTTTVLDPAGFEPNCEVDIYTVGAAYVETVVIDDIDTPIDGSASTITFTGGGTGGACANSWLTTHTIWLKGAGPAAATTDYQMLSIDDACAAASLYGQAHTALNWRASLDSTTTTLSRNALDRLYDHRKKRCKGKPTAIIVNTTTESRLAKLEADQIRYADPNEGLDRRGAEGSLRYRAVPVIVDDNCPATHLIMTDKKALKIHRFDPFSPDGTDGNKKKFDGSKMLSENKYSYKVPYSGKFELRVEHRAALALMNALTA